MPGRLSKNNTKDTWVYYVYFEDYNLWKLGCTSKPLVDCRFKYENIRYFIIYSIVLPGYIAYTVEKTLLQQTLLTKYNGPPILRGGNTELRVEPIQNIGDTIATLLKDINEPTVTSK